jgi:hypothetical protein
MSALSREISNRLASALPATGRIPVSTLLALKDMTHCTRGLLEHELEIAIGEDLTDLRSHFHIPEQLAESGFRTVHLGLLHVSSVTVGDARRLLDKAVEESIAYLAAPRSFLLRNLADSGSVALDDNLTRFLGRLKEYEYFPDMLRLWIERKRAEGFHEIPRDEFAPLLRRIDHGMIAHRSLAHIQELLMPLAVLIGGAIPTALLSEFFADKSMHRVSAHLASLPARRIALAELPAILLAVHGGQHVSDPSIVTRHQLLAELRAAGVVLDSAPDQRIIASIQSRPALPQDTPHDN